MKKPFQMPETGTQLIRYCGDVIEFTLLITEQAAGSAWLRTNLGRAEVRRREIIEHVESSRPVQSRDWHDVPMREAGPFKYSVTLPLSEPGRFEAKAYFLAAGSNEPEWPPGRNVVIKVEPAEYCCCNGVYTAFVRQFGPNKVGRTINRDHEVVARQLNDKGYSVIPRSGTFRDLIKELDVIMDVCRWRILQLLPIHPVPTTYARMGSFFGSPFAALDFKDVDPALAEFDRTTTPMGQFRELVDAVHARFGKVFLDIPVNHTGWASKLQIEHPEWFARGKNREFTSPGAWGVTWEDLAKLDYGRKALWQYMAGVFLFWCRHGVDGFRCDAGYMLPFDAWQYMVAKVRNEYPDTVFMLEGLGGLPETVERYLDEANLDWAYSELFQNYDRSQIESYLPGCNRVSETKGILIHFAETHDNNRLASVSRTYARMRTAISALFSHNGACGITNGAEWFAVDKVDVHDSPPLKWGGDPNQLQLIARLNALLEAHPCFRPGTEQRLLRQSGDNTIALLRRRGTAVLLVLANLDCERGGKVVVSHGDCPAVDTKLLDLAGGRDIVPVIEGQNAVFALEAGEVLCLTAEPSEMEQVAALLGTAREEPRPLIAQRLRTKVFELYRLFRPNVDCSELDQGAAARALVAAPRFFCEAISGQKYVPVTTWEWPRDLKRRVMVPSSHILYVRAKHHFIAEVRRGESILRNESSIRSEHGEHFAMLMPMEHGGASCVDTLNLTVFEPDGCRHGCAELLSVSGRDAGQIKALFTAAEVEQRDSYALCTNGRGAMAQVRGAWGLVKSQYDALLAANLDPRHPVDRQVMLTRCRAWLVHRGYSKEIDLSCLKDFGNASGGDVHWRFEVPAGQGKTVPITISLTMHRGENAITLVFRRQPADGNQAYLEDTAPVRLIVRPDIEDRPNHGKTKAYTGPERSWPGAVTVQERGFRFSPSGDHVLSVAASDGAFIVESEWQYMVSHPVDAARGHDGSSDLFSPGYFRVSLGAARSLELHARVLTRDERPDSRVFLETQIEAVGDATRSLKRAMHSTLHHFVAKRNDGRTVIAGYPWFLDWGRDTLICLRGIMAAGGMKSARTILTQFARLESNGTLPNAIFGADDSNRDTSDAPLWFLIACRDLLNYEVSDAFMGSDCGGRTIMDVARSIVDCYAKGTPNGIRMDPESGLIYSPPHFTWMDTNHPACTPRHGYPVEIQALWYAALAFLSHIDQNERWRELAARVRTSIMKLYPVKVRATVGNRQETFLSDCLHAESGQSARSAVADDALRPNQLLAVTLGAVAGEGICFDIIAACEELLVPGAIRSLADRDVTHELRIERDGMLLNNPGHPYFGRYEGDEDTRRKPAYHNGTAWTWLFPSYCEALFSIYGNPARGTAKALLAGSAELINSGCIGLVPELAEGDIPHAARGCGAQAWGVTELTRVLAILDAG